MAIHPPLIISMVAAALVVLVLKQVHQLIAKLGLKNMDWSMYPGKRNILILSTSLLLTCALLDLEI
jgi:hypothetical protein